MNGTHHSLPPAFCLLIAAIIPNLIDGVDHKTRHTRACAGRKPQNNGARNACMHAATSKLKSALRNENEDPAGEAGRIDSRRIEGDQSGLPTD